MTRILSQLRSFFRTTETRVIQLPSSPAFRTRIGGFLFAFSLIVLGFVYHEASRILRRSFEEKLSQKNIWVLFTGSLQTLSPHYLLLVLPFLFLFITLYLQRHRLKADAENDSHFRLLAIIIGAVVLQWLVFARYVDWSATTGVLAVKLLLFSTLAGTFLTAAYFILPQVNRSRLSFLGVVLFALLFVGAIEGNKMFRRLYPDIHVFIMYVQFHFAFGLVFSLARSVSTIAALKGRLFQRNRLTDKVGHVHRSYVWVCGCVVFVAVVILSTYSQTVKMPAFFRNVQFIHGRHTLAIIQIKNSEFKLPICNDKAAMLKEAAAYQYKYPLQAEHMQSPSSASLNFLLITVDSLRADKINRDKKEYVAPFMHQLRRESIFFKNFYAPTSGTVGTTMSIMGLSNVSFVPSTFNPLFHARGWISPEAKTFAQLLKQSGYENSAIISWTSRRHISIKNNYFTDFDSQFFGTDHDDKSLVELGKKLFQRIINEPGKKHFVWFHLGTPHAHYKDKRFGKKAKQKYEGDVAQADDILQLVLKPVLSELRKNTVIILAADHGEEFGEHGGHYHANTVFNEVIRVPGIFLWPQKKNAKPKVIEEPTAFLDLFINVIKALSNTDPAEIISPGNKLLQKYYPKTIFPEINGAHSIQVAAIKDNFKLIYDYLQNIYFLFDLKTDKKEKRNLMYRPKYAKVAAAMKRRIDTYTKIRACFEKTSTM